MAVENNLNINKNSNRICSLVWLKNKLWQITSSLVRKSERVSYSVFAAFKTLVESSEIQCIGHYIFNRPRKYHGSELQSQHRTHTNSFQKLAGEKSHPTPKNYGNKICHVIYLFLSLPNPCNKFIKGLTLLFYKLIWNGKRDKIKWTTLCKFLVEGGLNMIEINVFIDSLKVTRIRKMLKEDKSRWMALLKDDLPDLDLQKYSGSRFLFSKRRAVNPFWRDVYSSFARFSERCILTTMSEFLQEPILFHHKIKIEGTVIWRHVWRRLGIRTIGLLTSENLEFLEYGRFTTKFGNDINFLEYYGMMKAIKNIKKVSI